MNYTFSSIVFAQSDCIFIIRATQFTQLQLGLECFSNNTVLVLSFTSVCSHGSTSNLIPLTDNGQWGDLEGLLTDVIYLQCMSAVK